MHSNFSKGPPPCKFGQNCKHFAQGSCKFFHPNTNQGNQGQQNSNYNPNPNPYRNQGGQNMPNYPPKNFQNFDNDKKPNSFQGGSGWGNKPPGGHIKHYNQGGNPNYVNQTMPPKGDQFTSKFCMSYQYNQPCKYQQKGKCSRIHGFDINDKIRRVAFDPSIPPQQPSKLGKFINNGQTYLILRMGNGIAILMFNNETSTFNSLSTWKFPKPQLKYSYYGQKQNFIYISAQNPKSTLHDIWIYDMVTNTTITIEEAHASPVTEVIHFNSTILLSSSKDGYIKIWNIQGNNAMINKQSTQALFNTYTTGKPCEILFLDFSVINGLKILSAGTNDNRILFFLGDQMNFKALSLSEKHALVYKIRYCTINDASFAIVLSWTRDSSASTIISIPLNQLTYNQMIQIDAKQNPRQNISLIEIFEDRYLFVANLSGNVTVYNLPSMQKTGVFLHKSPINSIIFSQYITKTQIKIPQIFMLENKYLQKNGSLGVYNIKK